MSTLGQSFVRIISPFYGRRCSRGPSVSAGPTSITLQGGRAVAEGRGGGGGVLLGGGGVVAHRRGGGEVGRQDAAGGRGEGAQVVL